MFLDLREMFVESGHLGDDLEGPPGSAPMAPQAIPVVSQEKAGPGIDVFLIVVSRRTVARFAGDTGVLRVGPESVMLGMTFLAGFGTLE
jgi:hypothetical protein